MEYMTNNILNGNTEFLQKKLSMLQEISSAIVATNNITATANLMLDLAINYANAEKGSLMLVNESGELYILAARGIDISFITTYKVKIGEGIAGIVAKNLRPVLVEDINKDENFMKEIHRDRYKTKSFISCPVISKNKLLGILNINDKKNGFPFTEDEFTLSKIIANQAAVALENAFLMTQLKGKALELEEINKRLIESDVIKNEFITRISHELRTPLNAVKGSVYCLDQNEKLTRPEQKEFFDIISNEASKLIYLVENLLDFLRLEDETQFIKKNVIDIRALLREVTDSKLLKAKLSRKNIKLTLDLKKDISDIVGDKIKVVQFFINTIEGLSHHLENNDSISITTHENDFVKIKLTLSKRLPATIQQCLNSHSKTFPSEQSEDKLKLYLACKVAESHRWKINAENTDNAFVLSVTIPKSKKQKIEAVIDTTTDMFMEFICEILELNICSIMLTDEITGELLIKSARGLDDSIIKRTRIRIGDSIAGWVALEGKPLLIGDIENDSRFGKRSVSQYNTKSLLSIPLKVKDRVVGVINMNNKKTGETFTEQDLSIASSLGERISCFIEKLYSGEHKESEFKRFIPSFEALLNAEKNYFKKGRFIPDLMAAIMDKLGADEKDKSAAIYVSTIYDLGLMLIDDESTKNRKLMSTEKNTLKIHPYATVDLLKNFEFSEDVKKAILHHHERYDGTGYPDKLKGDEIPFIARVLAVVDAFCAMITEKPYRKALTKDEALQEIKKDTGTVFDPKIINALEQVVPLI